MRKLTAIFFILVVVFNIYGYRLMISFIEYINAVALETKVDNHEYSDAELISVKTTLNLPYFSSSPEFERVYGSISIDGVEYEYVKKRVYKDTLELLCIPNHAKVKMQQVANEMAQMAADGQADTPSKKNTSIKIGFPDFCCSFQQLSTPLFLLAEKQYNCLKQNNITAGYDLLQEKPPQSMRA